MNSFKVKWCILDSKFVSGVEVIKANNIEDAVDKFNISCKFYKLCNQFGTKPKIIKCQAA